MSGRLLLDTHTFLWWLAGDERLSKGARRLIGNKESEIYLSAASAWEISTKVRLGKLPGATEVALNLPEILLQQGFEQLSISVEHARIAGMLPGEHRDPFDRMLSAQALRNKLQVVSNDTLLDQFGVDRRW